MKKGPLDRRVSRQRKWTARIHELAVSSCARCSIHCREASPLRLGRQFKGAWSHARSAPLPFTVNVHERVHLLANAEVSGVFSEPRSGYEKRSARPTC